MELDIQPGKSVDLRELLNQTRKRLERSQSRFYIRLFLASSVGAYLTLCKFSVDLIIAYCLIIGGFSYWFYKWNKKHQIIRQDLKHLEEDLHKKQGKASVEGVLYIRRY